MSTSDSAPDYPQPAGQRRTLNIIAGIVTLFGAVIVMGAVFAPWVVCRSYFCATENFNGFGLVSEYATETGTALCVVGMLPGALISAIAAVVILGVQTKRRGLIAAMGVAALLMGLCSCSMIVMFFAFEEGYILDTIADIRSGFFISLCGLSLVLIGSIVSIAIAIFTKPQPEPQQQAENAGGSAG